MFASHPSPAESGKPVALSEPTDYRSMLLALDSSDHANHGTSAALTIAASCPGARITGTHVFAAKMHDLRFRQMEGGLPEQFREERELERQRDVHDDLITRGLSIITDSYLDQAEQACRERGVGFSARPLEGKNYRALADEANSGEYDLLVIGALGLGAISGSRLGTVCSRVVRRSAIDTLVIRDPRRDVRSGPVVVAIDGSTRAFGGLRTAIALAQDWGVPLHVISSFDPYYHYVAFNRIAGVLSEEASKVFRFKEQEKLHEEIIDSGLAKIYEGHLAVAQSVADEFELEIRTELLDGKAHEAVERYVRKIEPSLLVIGKLGVHADSELDIGGNAENLLRNVDCSVLLSQREYRPRVDLLAEASTSWTHEAERRLAKAPEFVQNMARMAILRYAQERGHTVITERLVEEATAELMPDRAEEVMRDLVDAVGKNAVSWEDSASELLQTIGDDSLRDNMRRRAEKKALAGGERVVRRDHVADFVGDSSDAGAAEPDLHWQAAAIARISRAPQGYMRDLAREHVEAHARSEGVAEIDVNTVEAGLQVARKAMQEKLGADGMARLAVNGKTGKCPFAGMASQAPETVEAGMEWTANARGQLDAVPEGYCRDLLVNAAETIATQNGLARIDKAFVESILQTFAAGSGAAGERMPWDEQARQRIARAPALVRGMLQKEIEGWAQRAGLARVTAAAVAAVRQQWIDRGVFHLDPDDPRNHDEGRSGN
jgi:nucleotide-binding universal stress UspA family protein